MLLLQKKSGKQKKFLPPIMICCRKAQSTFFYGAEVINNEHFSQHSQWFIKMNISNVYCLWASCRSTLHFHVFKNFKLQLLKRSILSHVCSCVPLRRSQQVFSCWCLRLGFDVLVLGSVGVHSLFLFIFTQGWPKIEGVEIFSSPSGYTLFFIQAT